MIFDNNISIKYLLEHFSKEILPFDAKNADDFTPIFIVGCPRSGTTLLGNCIGSSTSTFVGDESLFLIDMWRIYSELYNGLSNPKFKPLKEYIENKNILLHIQQFSLGIFNGALIRHRKEIYIDHTPWYGLILLFIKTLFPNAKFVHVIRRGIDVANSLSMSYKKGHSWAGRNYFEHYKIWENFIINIQKQLKQLNINDFIEIKYEDFCKNPQYILSSKISPHCNIKYSENMLMPLLKEYATPARKNVIQFEKNEYNAIIFKNIELNKQKFIGDESLSYDDFLERFGILINKLGYSIN